MQTAVLDEVTLEYEVRGAGDPVVLIQLCALCGFLRAVDGRARAGLLPVDALPQGRSETAWSRRRADEVSSPP